MWRGLENGVSGLSHKPPKPNKPTTLGAVWKLGTYSVHNKMNKMVVVELNPVQRKSKRLQKVSIPGQLSSPPKKNGVGLKKLDLHYH